MCVCVCVMVVGVQVVSVCVRKSECSTYVKVWVCELVQARRSITSDPTCEEKRKKKETQEGADKFNLL